jgi:DNA-directed RNA polymerase subunit RPC12/RpoP
MIAVELNKYDIAAGTLRFNLQYPNLYRWKALDATNILTNKFGWVTNQVTKPRLYQTFIRYLKANMVIIRSKNCSEEMKTFQKEDMQSRAAEAALGAFDDELMATMIALYCGHEAEYDDNLGYQPFSKRVTLDNAPWIMSCGACGEKWGQEAPNERVNCPKCNSIRIYGQKNSDFVKDEMKETITDELFDPPESSFAKEYELL